LGDGLGSLVADAIDLQTEVVDVAVAAAPAVEHCPLIKARGQLLVVVGALPGRWPNARYGHVEGVAASADARGSAAAESAVFGYPRQQADESVPGALATTGGYPADNHPQSWRGILWAEPALHSLCQVLGWLEQVHAGRDRRQDASLTVVVVL
jgi:hypothetical protein